MGLHENVAFLNRQAIEGEIERLIGLLDDMDAPLADLEPEVDCCSAGDDGCGFIQLGRGRSGWGSALEADHGRDVPRYGVDQTNPPLNTDEVARARYARDAGFEHSPSGGWRKPR